MLNSISPLHEVPLLSIPSFALEPTPFCYISMVGHRRRRRLRQRHCMGRRRIGRRRRRRGISSCKNVHCREATGFRGTKAAGLRTMMLSPGMEKLHDSIELQRYL